MDHFLHHKLRKNIATIQGIVNLLLETNPDPRDVPAYHQHLNLEMDKMERASRQIICFWDRNKLRLLRRDGPLTQEQLVLTSGVLRDRHEQLLSEAAFLEDMTEALRHIPALVRNAQTQKLLLAHRIREVADLIDGATEADTYENQ